MNALGLLATAFLFGWPLPTALAADVTVDVSGAIANGPRVFVALCADNLEPSSCVLGDDRIPQSNTIRFDFRNVAPSRYAILAFQDIDGTGVLRRSKLGIPLEPFALSNDAGRSGRPSFEAAAVTIGGNGGVFRLILRGITHRSTP